MTPMKNFGRGWLLPSLLVALLAAVGGAAGWGWASSTPPERSATATVLVTPLEGNPFNPDAREGVLSLETEARLVASDAVTRAVAKEIGGAVEELRSSIDVEVPPNTQLLRITAQAGDPTRAREVADRFATAFLDYRAQRTKAAVFDREAHLREEIRSAQDHLASLTQEKNRLPAGSSRRALLEQQVSASAVQVSQLQSELTALGYVSRDPGQVVTPAQQAPVGLLARPYVTAGIGAGAALAACGGLLLLRRRHRRTVGSTLDLVTAGYDVLGPAVPDALRSRLLASDAAGPGVLLVADAGPRRARALEASVLAADLAAGFARARMATVHVRLAVCRDLEGPGDLPRSIDEVLQGKAELDEALEPEDDFLQVIGRAGGSEADDPARWTDLVASPAMGEVLDVLRERAQVVIVSGVELPGQTGELLVPRVDRLLLSVTAGVTHVEDLEQALGAVPGSLGLSVALVHAGQGRRVSG